MDPISAIIAGIVEASTSKGLDYLVNKVKEGFDNKNRAKEKTNVIRYPTYDVMGNEDILAIYNKLQEKPIKA